MTVAANRAAAARAAGPRGPSPDRGPMRRPRAPSGRLRVNVRFDMSIVETHNVRRLYEALGRCGRADVVFGATDGRFDYVFGSAQGDPDAIKIALLAYDPHGLPNDFDAEDLADPDQLALLSARERRALAADFQALRRSRHPGHRSLVELLAGQGYDVLAMHLAWPFYGRLRPLLPTNIGYMRVERRVPEWIFRPLADGAERDVDVFFLGATTPHWYPLRARIGSWLPSSGLRSEFAAGKPTTPGAWASAADFDIHQREYADRLRRSRIAPCCGSVLNCLVLKHLEAAACGCLVMSPMPRDADLFGFRDGWNMVAIDAFDFADKIRYYAAHEAERAAIARRGTELVARRHTATVRALEVVEKLEALSTGRPLAEIEAEHDAWCRREWAGQVSP